VAEISTKHAISLSPTKEKAEEVHKLIKIIREKVYEKNEILLETEVQIWP
jgi:UDP-N-acetylenolpyruvoylglucosamine reductase